MNKIFGTLAVLSFAANGLAEDRTLIPLWGENGPPYAIPHPIEEYQEDNCWGNVSCIHDLARLGDPRVSRTWCR